MLHDVNLEPLHTYTYTAYRLIDNQPTSNRKQVTITTMDTTGHNFSIQIFEFGGDSYYKSSIEDVAIIDQNEIWITGKICDKNTGEKDSLGNEIKPYNALKWDGQQWHYLHIPVKTWGGDYLPVTIESIHAFDSNDIWFTTAGRCLTQWDGMIFKNRLYIRDNEYTDMRYLFG